MAFCNWIQFRIRFLFIRNLTSSSKVNSNMVTNYNKISYYSFFLHFCGSGQRSLYNDPLRTGRPGDRIPVGARFSSPVQTGPRAHPASCTVGIGSFPGIKRPERGVDNSPPSSTEVKERVELYLYSPSGPSWAVLGWPLPFLHFYAVCNTEFLKTFVQRTRPARVKKYEAFTSLPLSDNSLSENKVLLYWCRNKIWSDPSHINAQNIAEDGKHTKVEFSLWFHIIILYPFAKV